MNIKKLTVEFVTVFAVILVTVSLVTFLWNLIGHGESAADWETRFPFYDFKVLCFMRAMQGDNAF